MHVGPRIRAVPLQRRWSAVIRLSRGGSPSSACRPDLAAAGAAIQPRAARSCGGWPDPMVGAAVRRRGVRGGAGCGAPPSTCAPFPPVRRPVDADALEWLPLELLGARPPSRRVLPWARLSPHVRNRAATAIAASAGATSPRLGGSGRAVVVEAGRARP